MKKIVRICSFIMVLALCITGVPVAFAQEHHDFIPYGFLNYEVNPILGDTQISQPISAHTYLSNSQDSFNPDDFISSSSEVSALIREALEARKETFSVYYSTDHLLSEDEMDQLIEAAFGETDQPTEGDSLRYAWKTRSYSSGYYLVDQVYYNVLDFTYTYFTTAQQEAELTEAVDELVDTFGFTASTDEKAKADAIYSYITDHVDYDYEHLNQDDYWLHYTAYAAMINKTAVCEGYAVLFYRLAEECGLDARVITGTGGTGRDVNHAWNIVGIGEYYYYLDATWDAERTGSAYEWYLKGHTDFFSHSNEAHFNTPEFIERYPIPQKGIITDTYNGPYVYGDFIYYANSSSAIITDYYGQGGDVVVPSQINSIPVISVDSGTFYENESIQKLTFSEGIMSIAPNAIELCSGLKSVHFPSTMNLRDYGSLSFTEVPIDCDAIETITVAQGNPYIKVVDGVLYNADMTTLLYCPPLYPQKELVIPDGVVEIGNQSISNSQNIEKITMPNTVERIWFWAFTTSTKLEEINISESCITLGQFAFMYTKIKELHIPATMTDIMEDALGTEVTTLQKITVDPANEIYRVENGALCSGNALIKYPSAAAAESYSVQDGIESIEIGAFSGAKNMKSIALPNSLREIKNSAFSGCAGLSHVTIPEGVITLGKYSFWGCDMLMSVLIPESVVNMEAYDIFTPNDSLTVYGEEDTLAETIVDENEGFIFKDSNEFICAVGHQIDSEEIIYETEFDKTVRYKCSRCGDKSHLFFVKKAENIENAVIVLEYTEIEYDGNSHYPTIVSVTYGGEPLIEGVDYTCQYFSDGSYVGAHYIEFQGIGRYAGITNVHYNVLPKALENITIPNFQYYYPYTGDEHCPMYFTVFMDGEEISWENLNCTYENNIEIGEGIVHLNGTNNYTGTVDLTFYIYSAAEIGATNLGGDDNIAVSGGVKKDSGLIEVDLAGANVYTLAAYCPHGDVSVYADKNHAVAVANGTEITPDGGITNLYALGKNAQGEPVEYTIRLTTEQYFSYTDTLATWAEPYINALNETGLGLIKGDAEGRFNGSGQLTRYQMAALLLRLQGTNNGLFAGEELIFSDTPAAWAENYVKASYAVGLIGGMPVPGTDRVEFQGTKIATRNQFFRLLMNVVVEDVDAYYLANKEEIDEYVYAQGFTDVGQVGDWAKAGTFTAIYLGYVEGSGGKINPNGIVTRNQAAVLLAKYFES